MRRRTFGLAILLSARIAFAHDCTSFYEGAVKKAGSDQVRAGTAVFWAPVLGAGFATAGAISMMLAPFIALTGKKNEALGAEVIAASTFAEGLGLIGYGAVSVITSPFLIVQREKVKIRIKRVAKLLQEIDNNVAGKYTQKLFARSGAKDINLFQAELAKSNFCPRIVEGNFSERMAGRGIYDFEGLKVIVKQEGSGLIPTEKYLEMIRFQNRHTSMFQRYEKPFKRGGLKKANLSLSK